MAADTDRLKGEVSENPETQELEVERLLVGFLRALVRESNASGFEQVAK